VLLAATAAWPQAVGIDNSGDLAVSVTADHEGCAAPGCARLRIVLSNTGSTPRFLTRNLLDVGRLRLTADGREFRLALSAGPQTSDIRERIDPAGGPRDTLAKEFLLPACCSAVSAGKRFATLPPGSYQVHYEGSVADGAGANDGGDAVLRSAPTSLTISASSPARGGQ
jgi:hypothetical protein